MRSKKKKNAAVYSKTYREKIRLKRLNNKNFDKKYRKTVAARQALYRAKKKQQQLSTLSSSTASSTSTTSTTKANLRKIEGLQRRRRNTTKLKLETQELQNLTKKLEIESNKLKAQIVSLTSSSSSSQQTTTNNTTVTSPSKIFFQNTSPNAKRRATARMMVQKSDLPRGSTRNIRDKFGINLSNQNLPTATTTTVSKELGIAVEQFLNNDELTRLAPDKKRIVDGKQVRFLLNHLINLHQKFILGTKYECSYSTFTRHIPSYIVSPKPNEWGTCLCIKCLNPQIKGERVIQLKNTHPVLNHLSILMTNDLISIINDDKKVEEILQELNVLKKQTFMITYVEWIKKKGERSIGFHSVKATITDEMDTFCTKFSEKISKLRQHMEYVHAQFKGAKLIRQSALTNDNVTTLQIDWSENYCLKQAREERSAFYYEQYVSILAGYLWQKGKCFSFACLSDETSHLAECTWVAMNDLFNELFSGKNANQITELNIISDSPSSQFRNKTTIYFLKYYATKKKVTMRWLFLESGHGKGIADGIGSTVKRLFDNTIRLNPDESFEGAMDLMNKIKSSTNIRLYLYGKDDIDSLKEKIPPLTTIKGTSMFHEIIALSNGKIFAKNKSDEQETLIQVNY